MIACEANIREFIIKLKERNCYGTFCLLYKNVVHLVCFFSDIPTM